MACLGEEHQGTSPALERLEDTTIKWILSEHANATWLRINKPETKPGLRKYMRLVAQEAHRRGIKLGT